MSILKHSTFRIISAVQVPDRTHDVGGYEVTLSKAAHKADFSHIELKPGYLYVRSRAISSRTNDNFDSFPAEEIRKSYKSFIGRPTFVNHNNQNHRRARGVIVDAVLHDDVNPDGSRDLWVECYHEVDAQTFPKLAQAIVAGEVARTSMGCDVEYSICSYCSNKAYTPNQYCAHIPRLKGKRIRRTTASGGNEDILVSEICIGLNFFENSLLVEEPADPTAWVVGVDWSDVGNMAPRRASSNRHDDAVRDAELGGYLVEGNLSSLSSTAPNGDLLQENPDGSYVVLSELTGSVVNPFSATASRNHVPGVVGVGAEYPMEWVMADGKVASMTHDQAVRDGANQLGVTPPMGPNGATFSVGQREASVSTIESTPRPGPAGIGSSASVNLGPVPFDFSHGESIVAGHRDKSTVHQAGPWHDVEPYWQGLHDGQEGEPPDSHEDDPEYAKGYAAGGGVEITAANNCPGSGKHSMGKPGTDGVCPICGAKVQITSQGLLSSHPAKPFISASAIGDPEHPAWQRGFEDGYYGTADQKRSLMVAEAEEDRPHYEIGYDTGHAEALDSRGPNWKRGSIKNIGGDKVCTVCGHYQDPEEDPVQGCKCTGEGCQCKARETERMGSLGNLADQDEGTFPDAGPDLKWLHDLRSLHSMDEAHNEWETDRDFPNPHTAIGNEGYYARPAGSWRFSGHADEDGPYAIQGSARHDTHEDAVAHADSLPKSSKVRALRVRGYREGEPAESGVTNFQASLRKDGVNGGVNETGIKRYKALRNHLDKVGTPVEWVRDSSYSGPNNEASISEADFHKAIGMNKTASFGGQRVASINLKDLGGRGKSVGTMKCSACGHSITAHNNDGCKSDDCKKTKEEIRQMDTARSRHTGIGEVVAPPQVDTLRQDACPICGSDDFNGDECPICMYTKPPDQFMDPDLDQAGLQDLRGDSGDDSGLQEDIMGAEGMDGVGDLACPECGSEFSGDDDLIDASLGLGLNEQGGTGAGITPDQDPSQLKADPNVMSPAKNIPSSNLGDPPPAPNEPHPGPHNPPDKPKADAPPAGERLPKPSSDDGVKKEKTDDPTDNTNKPSGPLDQANDLPGGPQKPDKEADPSDSAVAGEVPDDGSGDDKGESHKEGDSCPNCGKGKLEKKMDTDDNKKNPFADGDDDDKDSADSDKDPGQDPFAKGDKDEDGDAQPKDQKHHDDDDDDAKDDKDKDKHSPKDDKSKQGMKAISASPNEVKVAQSSFKVLASQAAEIADLKAKNADLEKKVNYIARAAGLVPRKADVLNPSQPVPAPASEGAHDTTQEAMTPMSRVDVTQIGVAPGATDVGATTTDTVDSIGGTNGADNHPYDISQTVTAPVAGTEGRLPLDQVRTVPEIQFGNPLKPDAAFPLQGDMANRPTLAAKQESRTWASIRLAQLRKECGTVDPEEDSFVVAQAIANNTSMSDEHIAYEIETLAGVAAQKNATARNPRTASRSTVPVQSAVRTMPSVASQSPLSTTASAAPTDDDQFGWI